MRKNVTEAVKGFQKGIQKANAEGNTAKAKFLTRSMNKTLRANK